MKRNPPSRRAGIQGPGPDPRPPRTIPAPHTPKGLTCRADLLRLLAVIEPDRLTADDDLPGTAWPADDDRIGPDRLTLDDDGRDWLGYVRGPAAPPPTRIQVPSIAPLPGRAPARRLPLRLPFLHLVVERSTRPPPEPRPGEEAEDAARPLTEEDLQPRSKERKVDYEDLVPQARLLPALRRHLGATRPGPLDLERIAAVLAARRLPRRLPRLPLRRWHPDLIAVLDFSPRLWPYREDMHRLAERLLRHCGRVELRVLAWGPGGPWTDWRDHQDWRRHSWERPREQTWTMPPAGTPVLIASDLGLLLGADCGPANAWRGFVAALRRARLRPLALAPLGSRQLAAGIPLRVLRWSPDAPPRPASALGVDPGGTGPGGTGCGIGPGGAGPSGTDEPAALADLLAMVAVIRRVDPPLLRALRKLDPRAPLDAGLEGALWCHPDVRAGTTACIRPEAQEGHLRHFRRLQPRLHAHVNALRRGHHAHLRIFLDHEETLLWASHAAAAEQDRFEGDIAEARQALRRLAAALDPAHGEVEPHWQELAEAIERRADRRMGKKQDHLLTPLVAARVRREIEAGVDPPWIPDWVDPARLAGLLARSLGKEPPAVDAWLVRDAASASLVLQTAPAGPRQTPVGGPLRIEGGAEVRIGRDAKARWLGLDRLPVALAPLAAELALRIDTTRETLRVAPVRRPLGAYGWGCDGGGIRVWGPPLGPLQAVWDGDGVRIVPAPEGRSGWALEADTVSRPTTQVIGGPVRWVRVELGLEPRFGVFADLSVPALGPAAGAYGVGPGREPESVTQRLRWIEPGTFLMGSPPGEPERSENEGPRHQVTLSRGFWLADTACTQALWQALMGDNPSDFKGDPQRPVEQVSWHDVQGFLRRLEALLPGCRADLPTEAQWEYACRAGTDTPFSFGRQITPEQVNYSGKYPYAGGEEGLYRGETVPVKGLPPNAWGLYEMHGNVWEWCADGQRSYDSEPQEDPTGPLGDPEYQSRVLRGGSWYDYARWARSAFRLAWLPGDRYHLQGFRFSLRSIEPGQVQAAEPPRPGGPSGNAPGGRPVTSKGQEKDQSR